MTEFMAQDDRAKAAYARFRELMDDLAWDEEEALETAYKFGVDTKQIGKKAVKQWFDRKVIPPYAVFNMAAAMGIDVAWLGGFQSVEKEKAIRKGGWFYAERERFKRIRAGIEAKRGRKAG